MSIDILFDLTVASSFLFPISSPSSKVDDSDKLRRIPNVLPNALHCIPFHSTVVAGSGSNNDEEEKSGVNDTDWIIVRK